MLRFRVGETTNVETFLDVGEKTAEIIRDAVERTGKSIRELTTVLDFGCGCGRTLRWLVSESGETTFYGADIDEPSIRWCRANLAAVRCSVNGPLPPTAFEDSTFDLVYAISVLTHINEEYQLLWLSELRRMTKPGGRLLVSVHGKSSWGGLSRGDLETLEQLGFLFKTSSKLHGILPDWYHTAYHSREYVIRTVAPDFRVLEYVEAGFGVQDLVVLERLR